MNPENAEHEHIGETVLYAANLLLPSSFRGKHIEQGLTFLDWVSNNSHLFEGTWTIEELGLPSEGHARLVVMMISLDSGSSLPLQVWGGRHDSYGVV